MPPPTAVHSRATHLEAACSWGSWAQPFPGHSSWACGRGTLGTGTRPGASLGVPCHLQPGSPYSGHFSPGTTGTGQQPLPHTCKGPSPHPDMATRLHQGTGPQPASSGKDTAHPTRLLPGHPTSTLGSHPQAPPQGRGQEQAGSPSPLWTEHVPPHGVPDLPTDSQGAGPPSRPPGPTRQGSLGQGPGGQPRVGGGPSPSLAPPWPPKACPTATEGGRAADSLARSAVHPAQRQQRAHSAGGGQAGAPRRMSGPSRLRAKAGTRPSCPEAGGCPAWS